MMLNVNTRKGCRKWERPDGDGKNMELFTSEGRGHKKAKGEREDC